MRQVHPADTSTEMTWIVLPEVTNALGSAFGGAVMSWIDVCAAIAAQRFSRCDVVTAQMDQLSFLAPIPSGHIAVVRACVNWAGRTSMEVGVRVEHEDPYTGVRTHTSSAYMTFVAIDKDGDTVQVPRLVPQTEIDVERHAMAQQRRDARLALRNAKRAR